MKDKGAFIIKGFKGYDKDFKCKGFQYEVGKEYETNQAKVCETGFHFCEHPLDVFGYYSPAHSMFSEVEGDGDISKHGEDSKIACTKIKIGAVLNLTQMVQAAIKF